MTRREREGAQVGVEALFDAGPQHLDGDGARGTCSRHRRAVHLRNRRGGDRRSEARKYRPDRPAERGGDRPLRLGLRKWRHVVLQLLEIARQRHADHVRSRRQELAELDIAWPEPRERRRQPRLRRAARGPLDETRQTQAETRRCRQHRRIDEAEHALAGEHEPGVAETKEMRGAGDHKRQPQCSATIPPVISLCVTRANPAARSMAAKSCGRGKRRIDSTR